MTNQEEETARRDTFDFDAFRAEQSREPRTFTIRGVEHPLADDIPVLVAMDVAAWMKKQKKGERAEIDGETALEWMRELFVDYRTALAGVGLREFPTILVNVVEKLMEDATPPPNRTGRRAEKSRRRRSISSKGGRSSRPTSSANTGSTFAGR